MSITGKIALTVYGALTVAHLIFCLSRRPRWQNITKVFLMPVLLTGYLLADPTVSWLAVAAILLGWGGDVLLLWPEKKPFFLAGLISFLGGHICYAVVMGLSMGELRPLVAVGSALALIGLGVIAYGTLSRRLGEMKIPVIGYLTVILAMTWTAVMVFSNGPALASGCLLAGALCFVTSDYMLARELFVHRHRWGDFAVMLTYTSAQLLLVIGLAA